MEPSGRNRWQPTATVQDRMVERTFATAGQRLPTIPFLLERESTSWLRKQIGPPNVKAEELERDSNLDSRDEVGEALPRFRRLHAGLSAGFAGSASLVALVIF